MTASPRIVVVAPNWLGDAVMALPAVADLRRHFASAHLSVAARTSVAPLFSMVEGIDAVVALPGRGGAGALSSWTIDAAALAAGGFDIAVLLPNSFATALIAYRAGIIERWGFAADWRSRLLTRAVPRAKGATHQAAYYQALVAGLDIPTGPQCARVVAPPRAGELSAALDGRYVVLAPGAAYGRAKQWLPERYAELAAMIVRDRHEAVVLVGSKADAPACDEIRRRAQAIDGAATVVSDQLINLCGATDIPSLASVLAGSTAVVVNDSGAMHLAGAVGARVVAIFGATSEHRTSPLTAGPDGAAPVIVTYRVWCRPCMLRECPIDHRCMRGVSAARVFAALPERA